MTAARHKAAVVHKTRRGLARIAIPALAATVVTGTVVGVSVASIEVAPDQVAAGHVSRYVSPVEAVDRLEDRRQSVSRSARRVTIEEVPKPTGHRYATAPLNLRRSPSEKAKVVTVIPLAAKLAVTGETQNGFAEVVRDRTSFWVSAEYLAKKKPQPEKADEDTSSSAPAVVDSSCSGSTPPSGVGSGAMAVYQAVCARFPTITTYGGWRGDGEHSDGRAVDIMVSGDLGWQVAEFLRANSGSLGLYDIIYSQRIWTAERSSEGWRYMEDRGSTTANHYDHVHVKVF